MMACKHIKDGAKMVKRTVRVAALIFLTVSWSACERRPAGPSPETPPRPQTISAVKDGDVQRAIFTYEAPATKSGHPAPPVMGENSSRLQV
jgi:hypothetical protein